MLVYFSRNVLLFSTFVHDFICKANSLPLKSLLKSKEMVFRDYFTKNICGWEVAPVNFSENQFLNYGKKLGFLMKFTYIYDVTNTMPTL